jgi:hypothetical protein
MKYVFLICSVIVFAICTKIYDLSDPELFKDEICSYNGRPDVIIDPNGGFSQINCTCQDEFANDPRNTKSINNVSIQCSYERKRRFITLFLSIFLPFGFSYLYLGHFWIFLLVVCACFFTLIGNCYRFATTQQNENYFKNKWNILFLLLALFLLISWIVNTILIWTGIVKDSNNIETIDDLYYLVNLNNNK